MENERQVPGIPASQEDAITLPSRPSGTENVRMRFFESGERPQLEIHDDIDSAE